MKPRPENWPALLAAYLTEWETRPFAWGSADCVHFAAGWLERIGYERPLSGYAGWSGPLSAYRAMRAMGGFEHAIAAQMHAMGIGTVRPAFASRGDVALLPAGGRGRTQALGIVTGREVAIPSATGLLLFPNMNAFAVWHP